MEQKYIRKSGLFLSFVAACCFLLLLFSAHSLLRIRSDGEAVRRAAAIVKRLGLTDLCLFTEARYTRNPSQADLHAPFQDHPLSLEHFPAGSLMRPPQGKKQP